jgi:hypothetical protein
MQNIKYFYKQVEQILFKFNVSYLQHTHSLYANKLQNSLFKNSN